MVIYNLGREIRWQLFLENVSGENESLFHSFKPVRYDTNPPAFHFPDKRSPKTIQIVYILDHVAA